MTENEKNLKLSEYDFHLPLELIAQRPASPRDHSRLMVYDQKRDSVTHTHFYELPKYLPPESTLVFNETKVFPCRLLGQKKSGGKCELFLLTPTPTDNIFKVLIKTSRKKSVGDTFYFEGNLIATIQKIFDDGTFGVTFNKCELFDAAYVPIPPYIRGGHSDQKDRADYQTLYAKEEGSVAAPTAGLHFTPSLFDSLERAQIKPAFVTLHVGLGTFKPIEVEDLRDHRMHKERFTISRKNFSLIESATTAKKTIAVGTTTLRVLESMHSRENLLPDSYYETDIFLHPGKEIHSIQGLITNFHLPKSSLLVLVSALIGREKTLELYELAIKNGYRFFSYGDAMLILRA